MNELTIAELEYQIKEARQNGATDDTPVHISYNYGDHWRTQVAPAADIAEMRYVEHSQYHDMDKLTEDEGEAESDRRVFIIW